MPLKKDLPLPDITLKAKTDAGLVDVNLRRNVGKGPTVILFFPLAFTGVCTDEMCKVTHDLDAYKALKADVIAISVDSPFAQEAWVKANNISITVASDFNRVAIKAFKVVDNKVIAAMTGLQKVAKRSQGPHTPWVLGHKRIAGTKALAHFDARTASTHQKSVSRAYGGVLSAEQVRDRVIRAFLVEEQRIARKMELDKKKYKKLKTRRLNKDKKKKAVKENGMPIMRFNVAQR
jgi:peroxiredoxin